jgi:hypothetical protein
MRSLLPLGALLVLSLAACTSSNSLTGPDDTKPSFACAGASGNCGGGGGGGGGNGQHNNNPNNPPATAP